MNQQAAFAASRDARANSSGLSSFLTAFPEDQLIDTHMEELHQGPFAILKNTTLDSYLLRNWYIGQRAYDAVYINSISNSTQASLLPTLYIFHKFRDPQTPG